MKQEFITSRGKAIIENNSLFLRNYKIDFRETIPGKIWLPVLLIATGILNYVYADNPLDYFIGSFWILSFLIFQSKNLYDVVVRKSFLSRIPLNSIASFEIRPDEFGLETEVRLHLKNGRYRSIMFRTLEKQYESFVAQVAQSITQPQLA
jgi:hypothetical protein